ncbi:Protein FAR1-RELATED SEQUENCE 5 [Linum grandiflorum]
MGGKPPLMMITNQDGAMAKAILKVILEATHRLCSWHLARNGTSGTGNGAFMAGFNKLVEKDCTEDEYNLEWNKLVATHELEDNSWVKEMYKRRNQWAKSFMRTSFLINQKTTSRSEARNAKTKEFVKQKHNLLQFFQHFFWWTDELRESEDRDDFRTIHRAPEIRETGLVALEQSDASKFTKEAFDEFKKQLDMSTTCICENKEIAGHLELYNVRTWCSTSRKIRQVTCDTRIDRYICKYNSFEYSGLPCRHMLFVLKERDKKKIPNSFVSNHFSKESIPPTTND